MKQLDRALQWMRQRRVKPYVGPTTHLLDVGCADGALVRHLEPVSRYLGIDPDAPTVEVSPRAQFIRGTFPAALIDTDERFDLIAVTAVLEHVPVAAQPAFARACARHSRPGSRLVITVPAPVVDSILHLLKRVSVLDGMRDDQHYGFDPGRTPAIFEPAGFRLERHQRFELGLNHLFVFQWDPLLATGGPLEPNQRC